jgi:ATP-dependent Lon protease
MAFDFSKVFPLLPLRDAIVFPYTTRRILVGRDISLKALEYAAAQEATIKTSPLLVN